MDTKEYIESIMPTMERMVQECTCAIEDRLCEHCISVNETNDLCKRITKILLKEIEEGRLIVASELKCKGCGSPINNYCHQCGRT